METNRQKKIGGVIQKDLVDILQGEVRKNGVTNLVISVSKVVVTSDLSVATVHLSIFPQEKAKETLEAIKTNTNLIKHDLSQRVRLQLRRVPNLVFFISLLYISIFNKVYWRWSFTHSELYNKVILTIKLKLRLVLI